MPYGWIGVIAALHFGMWYYLGIEGTCQAAEEVRSPGRALPLGTMSGIITLLIAAAITWYVACGLMPWEYIGWDATLAPLYDSARMTGSPFLIVLLFIGTLLSAIASANGCINDPARAWFSLGRDRYLPEWFAAVHPKYRTPFRSILFLTPIALVFALYIPLAQIITFSILSGLLNYTFMPINMWNFRKKWPLGSIRRGFSHPFHPLPACDAAHSVRGDVLRRVSGLRAAAPGDDGVLHRGVAVVRLLPLSLCEARCPVHHALAEASRLLRSEC